MTGAVDMIASSVKAGPPTCTPKGSVLVPSRAVIIAGNAGWSTPVL
jgi:hypothetical protein